MQTTKLASYLKFKTLANIVKEVVKECLAKLFIRVYNFYNSFNTLLMYVASYYQLNLFIYFIEFQLQDIISTTCIIVNYLK